MMRAINEVSPERKDEQIASLRKMTTALDVKLEEARAETRLERDRRARGLDMIVRLSEELKIVRAWIQYWSRAGKHTSVGDTALQLRADMKRARDQSP